MTIRSARLAQRVATVAGLAMALPACGERIVYVDRVVAMDVVSSAPADATDADLTSAGEPEVAETADAAPDSGAVDKAPSCKKNSECQKTAPTRPWCAVAHRQCVQCLFDLHCGGGRKCQDFVCADVDCKPGSTSCLGNHLRVCDPDGKTYSELACPDSAPVCVQDACKVCEPGKVYCAKAKAGSPSTTLLECNTDGSAAQTVTTCPSGQQCVASKCQACIPGNKTCDGDKALVCQEDGLGWQVAQDCGVNGWSCIGGVCFNICGMDTRLNEPQCVAWSVLAGPSSTTACPDGSNACTAGGVAGAVLVSNPGSQTAAVKVEAGLGQKALYSVSPGSHKILLLPPSEWKSPPLYQAGSAINQHVYRLEFDRPVAAVQHSPFGADSAASAGATRLLPTPDQGQEYWLVGRAQRSASARGFLTVVATRPGTTQVTVTLTAKTKSGPQLASWPAGSQKTLELVQGKVLHLETDAIGADLTGTHVVADQPVVVYGGALAAHVPDTQQCVAGKCLGQGWVCTSDADCPATCCDDDLQAQLLPVEKWSDVYLAARFQPRGKAKDVWRILAAKDGTIVTTDPPQAPIPKLDQGQWFELESDQDFLVIANKPVQLVQFMAGMFAPGPDNDTCAAKLYGQSVCKAWLAADTVLACSLDQDCPNVLLPTDAGTGDPEMVALPPVAAWGQKAMGLSPPGFDAHYATIVTGSGAAVQLDGEVVAASAFAKVAGGYVVARVPVAEGGHTVSADDALLVVLHGWSQGRSYAFVAGDGK